MNDAEREKGRFKSFAFDKCQHGLHVNCFTLFIRSGQLSNASPRLFYRLQVAMSIAKTKNTEYERHPLLPQFPAPLDCLIDINLNEAPHNFRSRFGKDF